MHKNQKVTATDADSVLTRKRLANAYLPRLACAYVRQEIGFDQLCHYFDRVAHLYTVGIDVNAICNLSCGYCYLANYNRRTAPDYIDLSAVFRFLDEVTTLGVDLVAIVGKEPFADDRGIRVLAFLDELRAKGRAFRYGVVTNGTLIDRYLDRLPRTISYVDISLDGDAKRTDLMRGVGVHKKAISALASLVERGYDTWVSSVVYSGASDPMATYEFMKNTFEMTGCDRFYLSPVRNFTGTIESALITFESLAAYQENLARIVSQQRGVTRVILDHPYEAVWRDYIYRRGHSCATLLGELRFDGLGNILHPLSDVCFRKLDVFPHGPWGTCRIDARGEYLVDVESRTLSSPPSVGNIAVASALELQSTAIREHLRPMLARFLNHMMSSRNLPTHNKALTSVSIPA